jgi:phytoene dehydrogenase-like protein
MKNKYDVVIIGAGIGGLVCGCYLVKAGLKVVIIEKHDKPGGYCSSFARKGYRFDVGVHYLGGIKNGTLGKILEELEIKNEIKFNQFDPTDKIIMPDNTTYIKADPNDTIEDFINSFPNEKVNIRNFFDFIMQKNLFEVYKKIKKYNFQQVLDCYFVNEKLKNTIGVLLLGNMGLPPKMIPAFTSIVFLREFILDPGYYPVGGIQRFADFLVYEFKRLSGEIILSQEVVEIFIKNNVVKGVTIFPNKKISASIVVSNIDATQTFENLLKIDTKESMIVKKLMPSISMFSIYIGMKINLRLALKEPCNVWYFSTYDIDQCYSSLEENIISANIPGILLSFPSLHDESMVESAKNVVQIFTMAPYVTHHFWKKYRDSTMRSMLSMADKVMCDLNKYEEIRFSATPFTFERYTLNKNGAAYGWASTSDQIKISILPQTTSIVGLFLVGHWCTLGGGQGGVSTVALSGKRAALEIISKIGDIR